VQSKWGHLLKLPNPDRAVVDIEKLTEYALNPTHPSGRHKARVFASALGLTAQDSEFLRDVLLEKALSEDAFEEPITDYGSRFVIDFELTTEYGTATIRCAWIVRSDEDFPRLTTCYVV